VKHNDLDYAINAVRWLLDHPGEFDSVDFHGLAYWAGRVEALRQQAREAIR
jgi:hypothetical protein